MKFTEECVMKKHVLGNKMFINRQNCLKKVELFLLLLVLWHLNYCKSFNAKSFLYVY